MKNKAVKRIVALILALVTLGSISMVSYSAGCMDEYYAEQEKLPTKEYRLRVNTAGKNGSSICVIKAQLVGDKGTTDWIEIGKVGNVRSQDPKLMIFVMFETKNVGRVEAINLDVIGSDDWYVNFIQLNYNGVEQYFYGGRWVRSGQPVTLKETDNVYKIKIDTSSSKKSGTDQTVYVTLTSKDKLVSTTQDLSTLHPEINAFEKGDSAEFYVYLPADHLGVIDVTLDDSWAFMAAASWKVDTITIEQMSQYGEALCHEVVCDTWVDVGCGISIRLK